MGMTPRLAIAAIDISPEWLGAISTVVMGLIAGAALLQSARAASAAERSAASSERAAAAAARSAAAAEAGLDVRFEAELKVYPDGHSVIVIRTASTRVFFHDARVSVALYYGPDDEPHGFRDKALEPIGDAAFPRLVHSTQWVAFRTPFPEDFDPDRGWGAWVVVDYSLVVEEPPFSAVTQLQLNRLPDKASDTS